MWKIEKYDDFRIQIIIDSNCNLSCEYCVLLYKEQTYKKERSITFQTLDKYIDFFSENYENILKYYRKITITFFWWEPLLSKEKVLYCIKKLYKFEKINFVIHTNWLLINQNLLDNLWLFNKSRYSFIVSIDGDKDLMLKYRLKDINQFYKIIDGISLLSENKIKFLFSSSIMKPKAIDLFNNYKFLFSLNPSWIIINPVTSIYAYREVESTKNILMWVKLFFDYLKKDLLYSDKKIIDFFWLPLNINDYKDFLKFWMTITWDIDGTIHAMAFAWQWFDDGSTYTKEELEIITLWNVIFNKNMLLSNICRDNLYKDKNILKVALDQNRKWTLPDWDVQNLIWVIIIKYFISFYKSNQNIKRCQ